MIEKMWEAQEEQQKLWVEDYDSLSDKEQLELLQEYILSIMTNSSRVLDEVNWKSNILSRKQINTDNITEHCVDILKYVINTLLIFGVSPVDFTKKFDEKTDAVQKKWDWERKRDRLSDTDSIITIDIDGVIANFSESFTSFIENKTGKPLVTDRKYFHYYMNVEGLTATEEERLMDEFIRDGGFCRPKIYPGAKDSIDVLKSVGFHIVFLTARPYNKYRRIFRDTTWWMEKHKVNYDAILWDKDKADAIKALHPAFVLFHVEDRDKHAVEVANSGVDVLLFDKPYNQTVIHDKVQRITRWSEVIERACSEV